MIATLRFICVHISIECQTVIPEVADRHSHGSLKNFRPQKPVETTLLTSSRDSTQGSDSFLESPPGVHAQTTLECSGDFSNNHDTYHGLFVLRLLPGKTIARVIRVSPASGSGYRVCHPRFRQ
jgi:hypothetical protein